MIHYKSGKYGIGLKYLCQLHGSVFTTAASLAIGPALFTILVKVLVNELGYEKDLLPMSLYNTFTWVLGFVIVFRTSVAYGRYWEGVNQLEIMHAEWYDACAQILSFAQVSQKPKHEVQNFSSMMVQLFSLMHCYALQQVADMEQDDFDVIDVEGMDDKFVGMLEDVAGPHAKVQTLLQWISRLTLDGISNGMIPTPPPIVSRSFQQLNGGMIALGRMTCITEIPYPFPYAQMISFLLIIHSVVTPVVLGSLQSEFFVTAPFTFISIFCLVSLNLIAQQIESPFGDDHNDLDCHEAQKRMNSSLLLLLDSTTQAPVAPKLRVHEHKEIVIVRACSKPLSDLPSHSANRVSEEEHTPLASKTPRGSIQWESRSEASAEELGMAGVGISLEPGPNAMQHVTKENPNATFSKLDNPDAVDVAMKVRQQDEQRGSTNQVNKVAKRDVPKQSSNGREDTSFDQQPGLKKMCEMMEQAYTLMVQQCDQYDENHKEIIFNIQTLGKAPRTSAGTIKSAGIFSCPKNDSTCNPGGSSYIHADD